MLANVVKHQNMFWVFDKYLIDDTHLQTIMSNPLDCLWLSVSSNKIPQFNFATVKLEKGDVIKIGRVRFLVKEIVSPIYKAEQQQT